MNLLHVTPYYAPAWAYGGVVRVVTDLSRAQVAAGHRVFVLTTDTLDGRARVPIHTERVDDVHVVRVRNLSNRARGALNISSPVRFGRAVRRLLDDAAIDLVHCHELRTVETLHAAASIARSAVPLVVSPHGTLAYATGRRTFKRLWDRLFGPWLLPRIDGVLALTPAEAADTRALWARYGVPLTDDRVVVIPNGVHPEDFARLPSGRAFRQRWGLGEDPVVLFLGRLTERKNVGLLVSAFACAIASLPRARLVIAGPDEGVLSALRAQVAEYQLGSHVTFTGLLVGDDRLAAFAAADIFALPAVGEGFSVAALEAMACGLPVALSPECRFPEVQTRGAGLVVPRDVGAWTDTLRMLLAEPQLRVAMGTRGRELVCRSYAWSRIAERMDVAYRAVPGRRRRSAIAAS